MPEVSSVRTKAIKLLLFPALIEDFCHGPFLAHLGAIAVTWRAAGNWDFPKAGLVVLIAAAFAGEG